MSKVDEFYCLTHDAGSWSENALGSDNRPIVKTHRDLGCHVIPVKDKPKSRGKKHWGHTEIENLFANHMNQNYDEMFHEVIASCKIGKMCLLRNKWQFLYPIGNSYKIGVMA